ncbi:MAG: DUF3492 domain-containing protein, partial [Spirochaetaceae bacterium]|nr:DUF3492 domain-containing protein [Spirochaetaceae bacterium]
MRVCMVVEGSYPFITGGVSSWIHELVSGLPEIEFALFTFSPESGQKVRYTLPPNVVEHKDVVLSVRKGRKSLGGPGRAAAIVGGILGSHERMFSGSAPEAEALVGAVPEGFGLDRRSILDSRA